MKDKKSDSFLSKFIKFIKKQCILAFISIVILIIGCVLFIDSKIKPITLHLPDAVELVGPLSINERLRSSQVLHLKNIKGCESMVQVRDYVFCGTQDSRLVKFNDTHIVSALRLGDKECKRVSECGRCLGLRHDVSRNVLVFVDAYRGIFEYNLDSGALRKIFPREGDSFKMMLFNDLDILSNGDIVVTESSTKFQLHDLISALVESRANGRLILVSRASGQHRIIADNLYFPNGVQVHKSNPDVVLVVETLKTRILAINVREVSPILQNIKIFADSLPGFPDNIRPSFAKEGYWVNFASIRHSGNTFFLDIAMTFPFIRNCLKKFFSDQILHLMMSTNHGIVVRYDEFGNVAESLHDPLGVNVTSSSETLEVGNALYLGSFYLPYVVKVAL